MAGRVSGGIRPRRKLGIALGMLIELLAAVPSIVYGLWGLFVLAPIVSDWIGPALQAAFGFLPIFQGTIYGVNMLTAALILTLMIIPTITAITRDLIAAMPMRYRESALASWGDAMGGGFQRQSCPSPAGGSSAPACSPMGARWAKPSPRRW